MPLESAIEQKSCKKLLRTGCLAVKCTGINGIPDRVCVWLDDGTPRVFWLEFKQPKGKLSPIQERIESWIPGNVYYPRSINQALDAFMEEKTIYAKNLRPETSAKKGRKRVGKA